MTVCRIIFWKIIFVAVVFKFVKIFSTATITGTTAVIFMVLCVLSSKFYAVMHFLAMQNLLQNLANLSLTFYKLITKNRWIPTHYIISCAQMLVVGASNILILLIILISIMFLDLEIVFFAYD